MSNRHQTITVECTGDEDESEGLLSAYIAGMKAAGIYFHNKSRVPDGPEAVDAPALDASIVGQVKITNPNFNVEDGVDYYLQYSDDYWETFTTIADNQGPNDENYYTYNDTRRFRLMAGSVPGKSTTPIP